MKYLLGIDFGGGASKATLLSENGTVVAVAETEYPTFYPRPGYTEQLPADWYEAAGENIARVIADSGIRACEIVALCFDAATHTAVLTDEDSNVLRPAILWTDTRCVRECDELKQSHGDFIYSKTMHMPGTIWTLPQLLWIRRNEPEVWAKMRKIMFAKDYVRYLFTGEYCTDIIDAQGSMLFDYGDMTWSQELCELAGIDAAMLPPLKLPSDIVGRVTKRAASETGLAEGTAVICGTTDTALEVLAAGAVRPGQMTIKLATAGRICVITQKAYPDLNLINYSHVSEGLWYPGTATKSSAASLRWFRDTFGGDYPGIDILAEGIRAGSEGLIFHPYLNGELTPYGEPLLRASFTGVSSGHGKGHFCRAVLEGVALSMLDCLKTIDDIGMEHEDKAMMIGGGAQSRLWRQILSDALGMVLIQPERSDSSLGAAMLAGVAVGVFKDYDQAVSECTAIASVTDPDPENGKIYAEMFGKYKAIQRALEPIYTGSAK